VLRTRDRIHAITQAVDPQPAGSPWKKSSGRFSTDENLRFSRGRHVCCRTWGIVRACSVFAAAVAFIAFAPATLPAADPLDTPLTATWSGLGLRDWADRVAAAAGLPVVVDRRLDPDAPVSLECRDEPLRAVLGRAAAAVGGDVAVLASTIRVVPAGTAGGILAAESARRAAIRGLPPRQRAALETRRAWHWPAAARPRDLLEARAAAGGVRLEGVEAVPHDHLPAASYPAISLAEALDLVLAHYDLRVDWRDAPGAGATGRIVGIGTGVAATGDVATTSPRRQPAARRGRVDAAKPPRESFSLRAEAPLEKLLASVAERLGLALDLDRESLRQRGIAPGEIVRLSVSDASREQLLDAILDPLALDWRIAAGRLEVSAPPPPER